MWSLGIIFYEIYYDKKFWKEYKKPEVLLFMAKKELPPVKFKNSDVPIEIRQIIRGSLVYDRKERMDLMKIIEIFESMK